MSRVMNWAPGVEMVLLSKHFVVVKLTQWVVVAPVKSRWSPPTVTRTRCTSALVGQMVATICAYVTLRSWVMEDFSTKKTVLVPVGMRVPTPSARRPKSLARALTQAALSGPRTRCQYSSACLLAGSMTVLACYSCWGRWLSAAT